MFFAVSTNSVILAGEKPDQSALGRKQERIPEAFVSGHFSAAFNSILITQLFLNRAGL
jgi:hypothetical protein